MTFLEECITFAGPVWDRYLHHPWIDALFAGKLSHEQFSYWLIQDLSYLSTHIVEVAFPKAPPNSQWVKLQEEYMRRAEESRYELQMLKEVGDFAKTRWAARPRRDGIINFWIRVMHEGTFGDICCAWHACDAFPVSFGERYIREKPTNLPEEQDTWVKQWTDPFYEKMRVAGQDGINEYGASCTSYEREKMLWIFLRGTQYQIGTFDAAWNLSDPWPGEEDMIGVLGIHTVSTTSTKEDKKQ